MKNWMSIRTRPTAVFTLSLGHRVDTLHLPSKIWNYRHLLEWGQRIITNIVSGSIFHTSQYQMYQWSVVWGNPSQKEACILKVLRQIPTKGGNGKGHFYTDHLRQCFGYTVVMLANLFFYSYSLLIVFNGSRIAALTQTFGVNWS